MSVLVIVLAYALGVQFLGDLIDSTFFSEWRAQLRDYAQRIGIPRSFVASFLTFALLQLPEWSILAVSAFLLGLSRWRWSKLFCYLLLSVYPVVHLVSYLVVTQALGLEIGSLSKWFGKVFGISLLAIPIGLIAWRVGIGWRPPPQTEEAEPHPQHGE